MSTTLPEPRPRLGIALGALDDAEAAVFEQTLAETLALLTPPVEPPPALRAALLARLDAPTRPATLSAVPTSAVRDEPHTARRRSARAAGHRPLRSRRLLGTIATLAAAFVIVAGGLGIAHGLQSPRETGVANALASVQAASDTTTATTSFHAGAARVTVVSSAELRKSVAIVGGAPAAGSGRTYELWYLRGGQATPAGLFRPSASGSATVALDGTYRAGDVVAATIEPSGGSKQPTTPSVFELRS